MELFPGSKCLVVNQSGTALNLITMDLMNMYTALISNSVENNKQNQIFEKFLAGGSKLPQTPSL